MGASLVGGLRCGRGVPRIKQVVIGGPEEGKARAHASSSHDGQSVYLHKHASTASLVLQKRGR